METREGCCDGGTVALRRNGKRAYSSFLMPRRRASSPATKQDIEDFANLIGGYCIRAEQKIDDHQTHMKQWKEDMREQVQLMMDDLRRDLCGANRDEIEILKERLHKVEQLLQRMLV